MARHEDDNPPQLDGIMEMINAVAQLAAAFEPALDLTKGIRLQMLEAGFTMDTACEIAAKHHGALVSIMLSSVLKANKG